MAGKILNLKKGDLLFKEGEESRSLYLIKSGILRIFKLKVKGDRIDLGTVKSNEVLGEMAFLDGAPRSASAEAMQDCQVVEIDFDSLKSHLNSQPDWFTAMIRSINGRLRDANNKIKQLETAAVTVSYKMGSSGNKEAVFEYFSRKLIINFFISCLNAEKNGVIEIAGLKKYYQNLFQENPTKLIELVQFFAEENILDLSEFKEGSGVLKLKDRSLIESYLNFLSEESKKDEEKQINLSSTQFLCAELLYDEIVKGTANVSATEPTKIQLVEVIKKAKEQRGKALIVDNFAELFPAGILSKDVEVISPTESYAVLDKQVFLKLYPNLKLSFDLKNYNEQMSSKVKKK